MVKRYDVTDATVYNFTVADLSTYYVEAKEPVLVHNCGGVYELRDESGAVLRTGRTNNLDRRASEHLREFRDLKFRTRNTTDDYREQRALEHEAYMDNRKTAVLNHKPAMAKSKQRQYIGASQAYHARTGTKFDRRLWE